MAKEGHNSGGVAAEHLRSFVSRIERLNEEKATLVNDIREVFKEASMTGFDSKALRAIIKERAQDKQALEEHEQIVQLYRHALGDLDGTPLGDSAIERVAAE